MVTSFLGITFVTVFTNILYIFVVLNNKTIPKKQNLFFLLTAVFNIFEVTMELFALILDNAPDRFRWGNFFSNFFGFAGLPLIEYCMGRGINPDRKKSTWFFYLWCAFIIWMIFTSIFGNGIFYIDENNHYVRDSGFIVNVLIHMIGILFIFLSNVYLIKNMQYKGTAIILLNFFFIFQGFFIQVLWPEIHILMLSVSFAIMIYYMYYSDILQQVDPLTGLFNVNNFISTQSKLTNESALIVIELENFAKIRHTYTRNETNLITSSLGKEIKKFYGRYGKCFRLNTEEFCVLVSNTKLNFKVINKAFFMNYITNNYNKENLVLFNIGYTIFEPKESIDSILTRTDASKRKFLESRLQYLYN